MCTTKTVNKYTASVPKSSLDQFVHMIGVITNPTSTTTGYISQKGLSEFEVFKTAQLARELDRFLFDDDKKRDGTYHQMCSRWRSSSPERPDLMVFSMSQHGTLVMPIVVSDLVYTYVVMVYSTYMYIIDIKLSA